MKRFANPLLLPVLTAALLLGSQAAQACGFGWWGASYTPFYSTYYSASFGPRYYSASYLPTTSYYAAYAPSYTSYYVPSYTTSYVPTYTTSYVPSYTTSYVPATTTTYYAASASDCCVSCCEGGNCALQTSYSVPSTCCSPCTSCVACCPTGSSSSSSSSASGSTGSPTPVTPRSDGGRERTFFEEEDPGYNNPPMDEGFSPRNSEMPPDPLDGTTNAVHKTLKFEIPEAPESEAEAGPTTPVWNLENKITSRPMPERTRLIARRSWDEPQVAKNITRQIPDENAGWVPVPLPTQLVQK